MIRRPDEFVTVSKPMKDGMGDVKSSALLNEGEFCNKGRLFSKLTIKPGNSIGNHTHMGDFEAYYILKGEGKYIENGEEKRLYTGDLALTLDGESHEFINDSNEDIELIALVLYSK